MSRKFRPAFLIATILSFTAPVRAETCPLAGETPMLVVRLYFGQDIPGKGTVSAAAWRGFLTREVTSRFPDGFTVYDAHGQWRDTQSRAVVREASKVVEISAPDSADARAKIEDIARRYRVAFHQQSVGIVSNASCAKF